MHEDMGCAGSCDDCACDDSYFGDDVAVGCGVPDMYAKVYHEDEIRDIKLSDYKGKWLILFFYPADFTFICPTELEEMAMHYEEFQKLGAEVISVSTDTVYTHKA